MSLAKGISEEFETYFKAGTILQATQPDELAAFSNKLHFQRTKIATEIFRPTSSSEASGREFAVNPNEIASSIRS